ncbi:hypothetical protein ccbrp13_16030 [Ktedonobacteria bacterium brp13]|nr:hypothetical protein ccbrp13_16030 [Ktedonobacteria bacterium brp13]
MKGLRFGQYILLGIGVVGALTLAVIIALSLLATTHGSTPAQTTDVSAGPYHLKVSLYDAPAHAGFALPFAIQPVSSIHGRLEYDVTSYPDVTVDATPVHASVSTDSHVANGVQGNAEIPVRGNWTLEITVQGPLGQGYATVPIEATTLPPFPYWIGWLIGLIPFYALIVFLIIYWRRQKPLPLVDVA